MSKKLIFGIILSILTILIGFVFGIGTIVKFSKLQNIINSVEEDIAKDNYYINIKTTYNGDTIETETFYRDGIGKIVSENGMYTWTDNEKSYLIDESKKTAHKLSVENDGKILVNNIKIASLYPAVFDNVFKRFFLMGNIENKIKTVKENDSEYIYVEINEKNYTKYYWIEKNTGILEKSKLELLNGDVYDYKYEIKYHSTTLKDIELPDLSEYIIIDESINQENKIEEHNNEIKE